LNFHYFIDGKRSPWVDWSWWASGRWNIRCTDLNIFIIASATLKCFGTSETDFGARGRGPNLDDGQRSQYKDEDE
jgi:hypothetical protein